MTMAADKTLVSFHFNPQKSGQILKDWAKGAGMSYQRIAEATGYTYDTINNSFAGRINEISLERVFKVATCTGHSVTEFIALMLQDEDISFAPEAALIIGHTEEATACKAVVQGDKEEPEVTSPGVMDRFKVLYLRMLDQMRSQYEAEKQTMQDSFRGTLAAKDDIIHRQDKQIISLTRKVNILSVAITLETVFIAVMLAVDVLTPSKGWFVRSLFNIGRSGILQKG